MYNFTLMIPTRHRPGLLRGLLNSLIQNTQEKDKIQVIIMYDEDDNSTLQSIDNINILEGKSLNIEWLKRSRSYNMSRDYFNYSALNLAKGKFLIALNDDTKFINFAWDTMANEVLEKYLSTRLDRIVYGITDDREIERKRNNHFWFSCFPLISIEAVKTLGFFFDPAFAKDGADWDIFATYQHIGRVLDLRQYITIEHISVRSGRRDRDVLDNEPQTNWNLSNPATGYNVLKNSELLNKRIEEYKSKSNVSNN